MSSQQIVIKQYQTPSNHPHNHNMKKFCHYISRIIHIIFMHSLLDHCILNHNCLYFNQCAKSNDGNIDSLLNTNISHSKSIYPHSTFINVNHHLSNQNPIFLSLSIQSTHKSKNIYELSSIISKFQYCSCILN